MVFGTIQDNHVFPSRILGYDFKIAVECALLAADAGAISTDEEAISIAGTGWASGEEDCAPIVTLADAYDGGVHQLRKGVGVMRNHGHA